ncbi:MAG: hypothetical protein JNL11_14680 [Bdellovibrionaceae bacterium]|nr:hypothetical protein [Pseudobdellovibrionaceae bacterium]
MSTKLITLKTPLLKFAIVFCAMFGLGYVSADYMIFPNKEVQSTSFASILMNAKMGKSLSFVNVQLEANAIPENPNDIAEITGYITLLKTTSNSVRYQWILPEGVQIVDGTKDGQFDSVQIEQPVEVKIKVSGYSRYEKKLLTLSANTNVGDTSFSNVALISSRPEDSHEYIAKQKYDREKLDKLEKLELSSESPPALVSPEGVEKIQK